MREDEKLQAIVRDLPWTEKKLRELPPFEFENWAVIALGGIPNKTQVGDMGLAADCRFALMAASSPSPPSTPAVSRRPTNSSSKTAGIPSR